MKKSITYQIDDSLFNIFSCDNLENILKEYQLTNYYYLDQIHSNIIHIVDNNYQNNSQGDGLITSKPNIPLVIRTADCIPILIYDKQHKVLGLIHSGWLGTLNNIIVDAINLIINNYHSQKENIYIYMYPSIHKCHFEVDEDVKDIFESTFSYMNINDKIIETWKNNVGTEVKREYKLTVENKGTDEELVKELIFPDGTVMDLKDFVVT